MTDYAEEFEKDKKDFIENLSEYLFFENADRQDEASEIIKDLFEKYEWLGVGRSRVVFRLKSKNYVLKFPTNCAGEGDNDWEGSVITNKKDASKGQEYEIIYPKTRLVNVGGFGCVIMEYVELTDKSYQELPDWCGFVDCCQVGYNKDRILMAFDYGLN